MSDVSCHYLLVIRSLSLILGVFAVRGRERQPKANEMGDRRKRDGITLQDKGSADPTEYSK